MSNRNRGRHRVAVPPLTERAAAAARRTGVVALPLIAGSSLLGVSTAQAGPAGGWDAIIQCESSGRNIENPSPDSSASGYFQFVDGTWRAYGGGEFASRAIGASFEEQLIVAERAFAAEGTRPWNASRHCWGGRHSSGTEAPRHALREEPRHAAPESDEVEESAPVVEEAETTATTATTSGEMDDSSTNSDGEYVVVAGDALSMIAAAHGRSWEEVFENNRDVVEDPDLIFPGERLDV